MRIHFKLLILVVHCFLSTWLIFRQMFSRIIKVKFRGFIFVTHITPILSVTISVAITLVAQQRERKVRSIISSYLKCAITYILA